MTDSQNSENQIIKSWLQEDELFNLTKIAKLFLSDSAAIDYLKVKKSYSMSGGGIYTSKNNIQDFNILQLIEYTSRHNPYRNNRLTGHEYLRYENPITLLEKVERNCLWINLPDLNPLGAFFSTIENHYYNNGVYTAQRSMATNDNVALYSTINIHKSAELPNPNRLFDLTITNVCKEAEEHLGDRFKNQFVPKTNLIVYPEIYKHLQPLEDTDYQYSAPNCKYRIYQTKLTGNKYWYGVLDERYFKPTQTEIIILFLEDWFEDYMVELERRIVEARKMVAGYAQFLEDARCKLMTLSGISTQEDADIQAQYHNQLSRFNFQRDKTESLEKIKTLLECVDRKNFQFKYPKPVGVYIRHSTDGLMYPRPSAVYWDKGNHPNTEFTTVDGFIPANCDTTAAEFANPKLPEHLLPHATRTQPVDMGHLGEIYIYFDINTPTLFENKISNDIETIAELNEVTIEDYIDKHFSIRTANPPVQFFQDNKRIMEALIKPVVAEIGSNMVDRTALYKFDWFDKSDKIRHLLNKIDAMFFSKYKMYRTAIELDVEKNMQAGAFDIELGDANGN